MQFWRHLGRLGSEDFSVTFPTLRKYKGNDDA